MQALKRLHVLNIGGTGVTDLSPLAEIDYTFAETPNEWDGRIPHFEFSADNLDGTLEPSQYAYLSAVPYYEGLNLWNTNYTLWLDAIKDTPVRWLSCGNSDLTNAALRALCEAHPELEELTIPWNYQVTDLSPVFDLPNLVFLRVSTNMQAAIRSLGNDYGFELQID